MSINWSKAPEGATHWGPETGSHHECWYKRLNDGWRFAADHTDWEWSTTTLSAVTPSREAELICRPDCWNGEGLPPVGTVCELRSCIGGWGEAEIKYQGRAMCVWLWVRRDGNTDQVEWADNPEKLEFRPIRTPEQIAAEEREKAVEDMLALDPYLPNTTLGMMSRADFCRALYNAGYRKAEGIDQ